MTKSKIKILGEKIVETDFEGIKMSALRENLLDMEKLLQEKLEADFQITPESVIGNMAVLIACLNKKVEEKIAFLSKQLCAQSADGNAQNMLYERVGLYKDESKYSTFILKVCAQKQRKFLKNSILIQSDMSEDYFTNAQDFEINSEGFCLAKFCSLLKSDIQVSENETFSIVNSPEPFPDISNSVAQNIVCGKAYENDVEFRERFEKSFEKIDFCTRNSSINILKNYVDSPNFLKIYDCKTEEQIPVGKILVVAKPNVSDEIFAQKLFENYPLGIEFLGDVSTDLTLPNGQNFSVNFQKAKEISFVVNIEVSMKNGFYQSDVTPDIKNNLLEYFISNNYGLNSTVNCYDFVPVINSSKGVEGVVDINIQKSTDSEQGSFITTDKFEYPVLSEENILVSYS